LARRRLLPWRRPPQSASLAVSVTAGTGVAVKFAPLQSAASDSGLLKVPEKV
jgi:hypothetical protein